MTVRKDPVRIDAANGGSGHAGERPMRSPPMRLLASDVESGNLQGLAQGPRRASRPAARG